MKETTLKDSVIPIYIVEPTEEELASIALAEEEMQRQQAEQIAKEEAKVSAQAKLTALGLTEDEVQALVGV